MLFLHFFFLFLFGTFAVAAPTSPHLSPQRFESPEPDVQPQTVHWMIPANGLGFWRRHPDEGKDVMNNLLLLRRP